ncbi:Uncharacterised protein [Candidatus Gugararchaeum adminiculabundum]|nr:Uncharacterised protein [Candidatus Gugararchaeum adminiculabundum]
MAPAAAKALLPTLLVAPPKTALPPLTAPRRSESGFGSRFQSTSAGGPARLEAHSCSLAVALGAALPNAAPPLLWKVTAPVVSAHFKRVNKFI